MNFDIIPQTMLMTLAGSRVYGTQTSTSDVDIKGVALAPKECYLGFTQTFEQMDSEEHINKFLPFLLPDEQEISKNEKLEGSIYELKKFLNLATQCNPNLLDVLFAADKSIRISNRFGEKIREAAPLFVSAKVRFSFGGYSFAQMKRIRTHRKWIVNPPKELPERKNFDLPEYTLLKQDQLNAANAMLKAKVDGWEIDISSINNDADRKALYEKIYQVLEEVLSGDSKWDRAGTFIGMDTNLLHLLERERKYTNAVNDYKQYQHWLKTRNPVRAELETKYHMDTKHASQLVRLMRVCKEVLTTGKINVDRSNIDAEELIAIRNGSMSYEQLDEWFNTEMKDIDQIYSTKSYVVPHKPNIKKIDELCQEILMEYLRENN